VFVRRVALRFTVKTVKTRSRWSRRVRRRSTIFSEKYSKDILKTHSKKSTEEEVTQPKFYKEGAYW